MLLRFITSNHHKAKEAQKIANSLDREIKIIQEEKAEKIEVQAEKLAEVVKYAANQLEEEYNSFFLEDAGLFINQLKGFPGVFSHFVFEKIGNKGILKLMDNIKNRRAEFRSVVALRVHHELKLFHGGTKGRISNTQRGEKGFGFDPIFIPKGEEETFGEMAATKKNRFSHRGKSIRKTLEYCSRLDIKE